MQLLPPRLIYIGDPMCSWCWAAADAIEALRKQFCPPLSFHLMLGGLRPYQTRPMQPHEKAYLKHHWEDIGAQTGKVFNFDLLQQEPLVYHTEPACRAVFAARMMNPDLTLAFYTAAQESFYAQALNLSDVTTYIPICQSLGLEVERFVYLFEATSTREALEDEFDAVRMLGANAFPTVLLHYQDQYRRIARGFIPLSQMVAQVEKELAQFDIHIKPHNPL